MADAIEPKCLFMSESAYLWSARTRAMRPPNACADQVAPDVSCGKPEGVADER